jgi:proteasome lid subunit RPN8/RPN11
MRDHVARLAPEEACGLLSGKEGRVEAAIPVTNELHSPVRFRMDPREQLHAFHRIEHDGTDLLAIYHSHPQGPGRPSPTDLDEFYYPGVLSAIWWRQDGEWSMRVFDLDSDPFVEVPVEVIEDEV